ncbi:MAG TPA: hypothetical protein VFX53_17155 [Pedococcus sp.]|nr:hypothetical protein [Pedococcus sp.]
MLAPILLAQAAQNATVLYQYGAIGAILLGAIYAVRVLFQREVRAHDLERQRADRMEAEVRRLNDMIQDKIVPVLSEATKTISEVLQESRRKGGIS